MALSGVAHDGPLQDGRREASPAVPAAACRGRHDGPATDEDLLEAFYDGDDEALERLIERYRWLRRYVLSRLPLYSRARPERADDIVQTAWIKVTNTRASCATRWVRHRGLVRSWLLVIVANCARDEARQQSAAPLPLEAVPDAVDPGQEELFEQPEVRAAVARCLASLPAPQRDVMILKFWVGMNQVEIAQTLGVGEATVSRRCGAARADLRVRLLEALRDEDP